jgi:DNA-binding phage protein
MNTEDTIRLRFLAVKEHLNERGRRLAAAAEASIPESGGIAAVSRATGVARSTIGRGLKDLENPDSLTGTVRRKGAGRPPLCQTYPTLCEDLGKLVEPATMGDPMRPLLWVSKSHQKLAAVLVVLGYQVSANTVAKLLVSTLGFRRQANRKTREGTSHPDRDAQFEHINNQVIAFQAQGQPVISVDTKKKELVGDFKNGGSDYRPAKTPDLVRTHDFQDKELGKAIPHGIYDIGANAGWVTIGVDSDTAEFAVNSLRFWWQQMGCLRYPSATRLLITADGGGSNGSRLRLWKRELQNFVEETGLCVTVCHYPPGTSKWNKIEHRLFCHISQNWRGKPLSSRLAIVELIAATTTKTGLTVRCELDTRLYEKAIKVSDEELGSLHIQRDAFHPEWNYTICPRSQRTTTDEAIILE